MKRVTIADIAASAAVIILVAVTLMPAVARMQRTPADAKCQSNLRQWGEAMELYLGDHYGCYPTNRYKGTTLMATLMLSQPDPIPPATEPPLHQNGVNWVEGLYPYIQSSAKRTDQDWKSFRRCPNIKNFYYPPQPASGANLNWGVSYVFNGALVEQPAASAHNAKKLMVIRELGRLTISTLRPTNQDCVRNPSVKPRDPFLNNEDAGVGNYNSSTECQLHGNGSYILFADGHVGYFTLDFYPETSKITSANNYDPATAQWWNYFYSNPATPEQTAHHKTIAITP